MRQRWCSASDYYRCLANFLSKVVPHPAYYVGSQTGLWPSLTDKLRQRKDMLNDEASGQHVSLAELLWCCQMWTQFGSVNCGPNLVLSNVDLIYCGAIYVIREIIQMYQDNGRSGELLLHSPKAALILCFLP